MEMGKKMSKHRLVSKFKYYIRKISKIITIIIAIVTSVACGSRLQVVSLVHFSQRVRKLLLLLLLLSSRICMG